MVLTLALSSSDAPSQGASSVELLGKPPAASSLPSEQALQSETGTTHSPQLPAPQPFPRPFVPQAHQFLSPQPPQHLSPGL